MALRFRQLMSPVMPHFIIEYAQSLEAELSVETLLQSVYNGAIESQLFDPAAVKVRAVPYRHYTALDQHQRFVHVTASILSGRDLQQRQRLSNAVLTKLTSLFTSSVSLTVEVVDIDRDSYAKRVYE